MGDSLGRVVQNRIRHQKASRPQVASRPFLRGICFRSPSPNCTQPCHCDSLRWFFGVHTPPHLLLLPDLALISSNCFDTSLLKPIFGTWRGKKKMLTAALSEGSGPGIHSREATVGEGEWGTEPWGQGTLPKKAVSQRGPCPLFTCVFFHLVRGGKARQTGRLAEHHKLQLWNQRPG